MRIIIDISHDTDAKRCLDIALENGPKMDEGEWWGYWSQRDPDFSAVVRKNKASVSVRGRRNPPTVGEGE